jgi:putative spermidine/putrescine transport system permease protein
VRRFIDDTLAGVAIVSIVLTFGFLAVPLLITALMAFDSRNFLGPLPPLGLSLQWFERFFDDKYLIQGLKTSVAVSMVAVAFSTVLGFATAVGLDRARFRSKAILATVFMSPLVVPPVVIGFALLLFLANLGIVDGFTRLVCGHLILTLPYTVRATLAGLVGIGPELTEAAMSLGATERQAFWSITFPLARTGIIAGAIFGFAVSIDDVAVSMFLTDAKTYTLPVALVSSMRAKFDLTIAAASVLLIGFTLLVLLLLEYFVGVSRFAGEGLRRN